ncbi:MAG: glycosyltransferase, partial [Bacteroidetes bacterium]|nr:glycosyltransferase [Bacteroidota bacterium]
GHTVTAAVMNTSKHRVNLSDIPETVKNLATWHLINIQNHITPLGALGNLFRRDSYILSRFKQPLFEDLLKQLLQKTEFDLIIFESLQSAVYINKIKPLTKAKCLLRSHNIEHHIWQEQEKLEPNFLKRWYLRVQTKRLKKEELKLTQQMDGILAISKADAESYKSLGIHIPILYYPVGFELMMPSNIPKPHTAKVFHLGSMDWMPNQVAVTFFLDEVWPLVVRERNLIFEVAGRNMPAHFSNLKQEGVSIKGEVEDAAQYIQENGIMVISLKSGSGMRVKVMEGMALGKCIISTSKGMEGIAAVPNKHFILANTPTEFKDAILHFTENLKEADNIGLEARKFATEEFNNKNIVANLTNFVAQLNKD